MKSLHLAKLLLRLAVGGLMLLHGIAKLQHGIEKIAETTVVHGLPRPVAYGVFLGEVVAPILVLIGLWTRPAAAVIAINMIVAVWLAHTGDLFHLGKGGGYALELQALYFLGSACIALLGAGSWSVTRGTGRLN